MLRRWAINLLLIAGGVGAGWVSAELALRVLGYPDVSFYRSDPCCGASLRPGAEGWWRKEGEAYVRINSDGLRDREHTLEKPAGTLRIAVLGDSYAEAMQVPLEQAFWSVLERRLSACPALNGKAVEVINFGVAGYGTTQELQMLRHKAWRYDPDIVLLAFLTGNDLRNNSRDLESDRQRPFYFFENRRLVYDDSFLEHDTHASRKDVKVRHGPLALALIRLVQESRVIRLLEEVGQNLTVRSAHAGPGSPKEGSALAERRTGDQVELGLDDLIYVPPRSDAWRDAWKVTEAVIAVMAQEIRARGARMLFVSLSNGIQVTPDRARRERYMRRRGIEDIFYPDRRLVAVTENLGIPTLMLAPPLQMWAEANATCVHGFDQANTCSGHWNAHGHRLAGEAIAEKMCRQMLG